METASVAVCLYRIMWGLGLRILLVLACSSCCCCSVLLANAAATRTATGDEIGTDSVLGIELNNVQLLPSKVEVSEISAFLQTTTTTLPAAVAAATNRRAVASLDNVDTASKLQATSKLELHRSLVSESNPEVMEAWEEAKAGDHGGLDQNVQDQIRMERLLRFSDYVDPSHHPPQEPPSLIDP
ncbi:unnamed protein product [Sphagnum troendelagicum]|uniref:Transmembrane protein n=1 Tax=Sphagnum troendelagicum TaxID=128251 RepID=A0ABP0UP86_9BRYO